MAQAIICNKCNNIKLNKRCNTCDANLCKKYRQKLKLINKEKINQGTWVRPDFQRCTKCKKNLKGTYFNINTTKKNGLCTQCKYCDTVRKNKHVMELTQDQFFEIMELPCHYCGSLDKVGVDRYKNEIHYVISNCVPCCGTCNKMKHVLDGPTFLEMVERINNHRVRLLNEECQQLFDAVTEFK